MSKRVSFVLDDTDPNRTKRYASTISFHTEPKKILHKSLGSTVISKWGKVGTVQKIVMDENTKKKVFIVDYYAGDLPECWNIGGQNFSNKYLNLNPTDIITIGHTYDQIKCIKG